MNHMCIHGKSEHVLQKYKKYVICHEKIVTVSASFFTSLGKSHTQNYSTFQLRYIQHVPNLNTGRI
jgi:hypothetical protein